MKINRLLVPSMAILGPSPSDSHHYSLFTFGDSYTSTEFNPSGMQPSLENPMGNPSLGKGTTAGGVNWVGYLTTVYNASVTMNFNLAVFGATVDNAIVYGEPVDLVDQVSGDFLTYYCSFSGKPGWKSDTALFAIWIGINDVQASYMNSGFSGTTSRIQRSYFDLLEQLHDCGARHFLLLNVPPTTRTPKILGHQAWRRERHRKAVVEFNNQLQEMVVDWQMAHSDSTLMLYDAWSFMTTILDNPREYGFKDNSCMGKGCVWWDDYHPTSAFHRLLAADVARHLRRETGAM